MPIKKTTERVDINKRRVINGEYREPFVKKIRARSQSQEPFQNFESKEAFLKHVRAEK